MLVNYSSEICCELCNEIIHNHFECPKCKKSNAGTSLYGQIDKLDIDQEFYCEECETVFILKKFDWKELEIVEKI